MANLLRVQARNGPSPTFELLESQALSLAELSDHVANRRTAFKVRARVRVHEALDLPVGSEKTLDLDMTFPGGVPHYGMVDGGVLPPDYLLRGGTRLLLDRNVLSDLRRMPPTEVGATHPLRWLDTDGFHVNPILGAMEGCKQRPLCWNEFRREAQEAQQEVRSRLPRAKLVEFSGTALESMYRLHRSFVPRLNREQSFLFAIAGRLANTVAKQDLRATERFILEAAANAGLRPLTFVVLTALAKLYEGPDQRPAGKLLKLGDLDAAGKGWRRCAYNALADIRQMELLSGGRTIPDYVAALTGDVALAMVWSGLRPTGVKGDDGKVHFGYRLDPVLFPRLEGSTDDLLERVRTSGPLAQRTH